MAAGMGEVVEELVRIRRLLERRKG